MFNLCENQLIFTKIVNRNGLEWTDGGGDERDAISMNCFIKRKTHTNRLYCIVCHMCDCGGQIFAANIIFTNYLAPQLNTSNSILLSIITILCVTIFKINCRVRIFAQTLFIKLDVLKKSFITEEVYGLPFTDQCNAQPLKQIYEFIMYMWHLYATIIHNVFF